MNMRYDLGEMITAMVTPFNTNDAVDFKALEKTVHYITQQKSDGIVVCGTTGEGPTLTATEKQDILRCVKSVVSNQCKIIMNAGSNFTRAAVESAQQAQKMGADAILSVVPYYNKPSQSGLIEHFASIAHSVDIPIMLYNIPGRCAIDMAPNTMATLTHKYPNIVAVKQSNANLDLISEIRQLCPDDFAVYSGDDSLTLPMLSLGAHGVVSVASHVAGNEIKSMIKNYKSGNVSDATRLHMILYPLFKKIFMAPNPTPIKSLMAKLGLGQNRVRRPLVELGAGAQNELYQCLTHVKQSAKAL